LQFKACRSWWRVRDTCSERQCIYESLMKQRTSTRLSLTPDASDYGCCCCCHERHVVCCAGVVSAIATEQLVSSVTSRAVMRSSGRFFDQQVAIPTKVNIGYLKSDQGSESTVIGQMGTFLSYDRFVQFSSSFSDAYPKQSRLLTHNYGPHYLSQPKSQVG